MAWLTGYRRLTLRYERVATHFLASAAAIPALAPVTSTVLPFISTSPGDREIADVGADVVAERDLLERDRQPQSWEPPQQGG